MKRVTERTLVEFNRADAAEIDRLFQRAQTLYDKMTQLQSVFIKGEYDFDAGEWKSVPAIHPRMSRQKLLDDLAKVSTTASELGNAASDYRTKVLDT